MRRIAFFTGTIFAIALGACGDNATELSENGLLPAPPDGMGFHITTGDFPVDPGTEVQDCYFFKVRDLAASGGMNPDEPVYLHRTQIAYRPGSHHMNIFRVR